MEIITLTSNNLPSANCYILIYGNSYSVIDPSISYDQALAEVPKLETLLLRYIILTHAHLDHMWGINTFVERGGEVLVSKPDSDKLADPQRNCSFMLRGRINSYTGKYRIVSDNEELIFGNETLKVLLTPGHTSGSICLMADKFGFTGDTLFAGGSYGRYDLPTGDARALAESLRTLLSYPDDFVIYPGHGQATTIKQTKIYF